jgi:uncharacterized membrane protein
MPFLMLSAPITLPVMVASLVHTTGVCVSSPLLSLCHLLPYAANLLVGLSASAFPIERCVFP